MSTASLVLKVELTDVEGNQTARYGDTIAKMEFEVPPGLDAGLLASYCSIVLTSAAKNLLPLVTRSPIKQVARQLADLLLDELHNELDAPTETQGEAEGADVKAINEPVDSAAAL